MIDFHCSKRHRDQTPVVKNTDIMDFAEAQVGDYKPKLLKEPGKIKSLHFIESYLGANVDYMDIYYPENTPQIAGATVFNDDIVRVFDKENLCIRKQRVPANTILIDNSTMQPGKEGFAQFTVLHEGGHFCMHSAVYRRCDGQLSLFDFGLQKEEGASVVCCRMNALEGVARSRDYTKWTQEDYREHQADVYAASVAMPRQTFVPTAMELNRKAGFRDGIFVTPDELDWDYELGVTALTENLSNIFGVSKAAANVQLKRLGLLMTEDEYLEQHRQFAVAF